MSSYYVKSQRESTDCCLTAFKPNQPTIRGHTKRHKLSIRRILERIRHTERRSNLKLFKDDNAVPPSGSREVFKKGADSR